MGTPQGKVVGLPSPSSNERKHPTRPMAVASAMAGANASQEHLSLPIALLAIYPPMYPPTTPPMIDPGPMRGSNMAYMFSTSGAYSNPLKNKIETFAPIIPPTNAASVIGITSSFDQCLRRASIRTQPSPANNPNNRKNPCE